VTAALLTDITIFVLALLVGFEVISKVPATLHTPLMSAANSIHGIILVGAMLIAAAANNAVGYALAFVAAAFAAMNVVGGYVVTGRMLKMFRRRPTPVPAGQAGQTIQAGQATQAVQAAQAAPAGQATPDGQVGQAGQPSQLGGGGTRS
jgi:H+-translocating NAD(P) transhydrogenase subunit alpha